MAKQVLLDTRIFAGGADLSGWSNQVELMEEAETKATTNFRSGGAREVLAGLVDTEINAECMFEAGDLSKPDDAAWAQLRTNEPWSLAPEGSSDLAAGSLMYLTRAITLNRAWLGDIGEVAGLNFNAKGNWPLARGVCAHPSGVARTAGGNGTSLQLGALTTGKHLYANLHVLSISGTATPTLTVNIQSDNAIGFPSASTRGAFAARTTVGGEALRIAAPVTDDWWRITWSVSGTNPSFLFLVSLGIE